MRNFIFILLIVAPLFCKAQLRQIEMDNPKAPATNVVKEPDSVQVTSFSASKKETKPAIKLYKIYNLQKDTTFVDTSLSIKNEYRYNLLRKDIFGLLPFANEGQTYNTLDYGLTKTSNQPEIGFKAKHFNYYESDAIRYYNVPTPLTDLYYKTVMEQGQSLDAFLTMNTKKNLNFSIAYKGLRSNGNYVNAISSSGNFRFTSSYFSPNKRYFLNAHFTGQDISNLENGGISNPIDFESGDDRFKDRNRLDVYYKNAKSFLKGNRFFINQQYKINPKNTNGLLFTHQFTQEYKFFEFTQALATERYGAVYSSRISDKTRFNHLYNKFAVAYTTKNYGDLAFFADHSNSNYFYNSGVFNSAGFLAVPNAKSYTLTNLGADYHYFGSNFTASFKGSQSISSPSVSDFLGTLKYKWNNTMLLQFSFNKTATLPSFNFSLLQSDYVKYNWNNDFKTLKNNQFNFIAQTKWVHLEGQYRIISDFLYFKDTSTDVKTEFVRPFQYDKTISYFSIKANKEIKFWKFALDNTILFQSVDQEDAILNVPEITTRNTLYFSQHVFKKAMYLQTGFTFQYFTSYFSNKYNPIIGEFYVQNTTKIGNFPLIDFFVNARIRQTRIFLKAEHFNSAFTGNNFYAAPNYPYQDFMIRFGLEWNFFK